MKLCPVDLAGCDRAYCRGGHCAMAETEALTICWECGTVASHGITHGICVECVTVRITAPAEEEL